MDSEMLSDSVNAGEYSVGSSRPSITAVLHFCPDLPIVKLEDSTWKEFKEYNDTFQEINNFIYLLVGRNYISYISRKLYIFIFIANFLYQVLTDVLFLLNMNKNSNVLMIYCRKIQNYLCFFICYLTELKVESIMTLGY